MANQKKDAAIMQDNRFDHHKPIHHYRKQTGFGQRAFGNTIGAAGKAAGNFDSVETLTRDIIAPAQTLYEGLERRAQARRKVLKTASLHDRAGLISFEGRLRNISGSGAMLELDPLTRLDETFQFQVGNDIAKHPARTVWRKGGRVGIAFL